eukprot:6178091-Pleurochrysis_carterae.AAC.1
MFIARVPALAADQQMAFTRFPRFFILLCCYCASRPVVTGEPIVLTRASNNIVGIQRVENVPHTANKTEIASRAEATERFSAWQLTAISRFMTPQTATQEQNLARAHEIDRKVVARQQTTQLLEAMGALICAALIFTLALAVRSMMHDSTSRRSSTWQTRAKGKLLRVGVDESLPSPSIRSPGQFTSFGREADGMLWLDVESSRVETLSPRDVLAASARPIRAVTAVKSSGKRDWPWSEQATFYTHSRKSKAVEPAISISEAGAAHEFQAGAETTASQELPLDDAQAHCSDAVAPVAAAGAPAAADERALLQLDQALPLLCPSPRANAELSFTEQTLQVAAIEDPVVDKLIDINATKQALAVDLVVRCPAKTAACASELVQNNAEDEYLL